MPSLCYYARERNFWISRLWVEGSNWNKRISTLYRCLFVPETKTRKSNFMLILCSGYAIMLVSEFFEYLGSGLKVPTEINGFLLSIDASLYQKRKLENLILCWFYANLCYYARERYFWISWLWVEGSNWNKRISTLYRCLFVPETKNRKSNFMLILCPVYAIMLESEMFEYLGSGLKVPTEINGFLLSIDASLYQKQKLENLILCWFYA